ncbi:MAG: hypothetical protein FWC41_08380 [Firmicutes bacterium]|nr:hypothetical protein [Bacillota bacterium]
MKDIVEQWNIQSPIDRWWREKYKIPFNSPAHRSASFIDMAFELIEDKIYFDLDNQEEDKYIPGSGDIWKNIEHIEPKALSDEEFFNLDIKMFDKFDKPE